MKLKPAIFLFLYSMETNCYWILIRNTRTYEEFLIRLEFERNQGLEKKNYPMLTPQEKKSIRINLRKPPITTIKINRI